MNEWTRVRAYTECPYCHATTGSRIVRRPRNLLKMVLNGVFGLIVGEPAFPFRLEWRCSLCRGRFQVGRARIGPLSCRSCGYNLTGNVSGICPECGVAVNPDREAQEAIKKNARRLPDGDNGMNAN